MAEGLHHFFTAQGFVDESRLLPPDGSLVLEQPIGPAGNEPGHQEADRSQHHDHERNFHMGGKHKVQGEHNGHQAGKQLGKAQEQPVADLVHIGNDPLDQISGAVAVQEGQGQLLNLPDGPAPDIPYRIEGQLVVDQVHGPGSQAGQDDQHQDLDSGLPHSGKIHLSRPHNSVNGPAKKDGHIQLEGDGNSRQHQASPEEQPIGIDNIPDFFQGVPAGCILFYGHQASSFPWRSSSARRPGYWESKISWYTGQVSSSCR